MSFCPLGWDIGSGCIAHSTIVKHQTRYTLLKCLINIYVYNIYNVSCQLVKVTRDRKNQTHEKQNSVHANSHETYK